MSSRKKYGKERRKHAFRKRLTYGFIVVAVIILVGFLIYFFYPSDQTPPDQTSQLKAVVIDHLGTSQPNQTFYLSTFRLLNASGYSVYYTPSELVTVDFYRNLPTLGYDLIIFRVHSTGLCGEEYEPGDFVVFFTSEPYSKTRYFQEQWADQVVQTRFSYNNQLYFGITPSFVRDCMNGKFEDTTIILMGCDGLKYTSMAEAFLNRGAGAYIGWDGPVMADHTDQATTRLLHHLITENQTIEKSVTETMNEVGPDPNNGSILKFYPDPEAADYKIPHSANNMDLDRSLRDVFYSAVWFGDEKDYVSRLPDSHSTCIQQWNAP